MLRKAIGARIQILRIQQKLTQSQLALSAGVHRSYLASIESGERNISLDSLEKIIQALNLDYDSFFKRLTSSNLVIDKS